MNKSIFDRLWAWIILALEGLLLGVGVPVLIIGVVLALVALSYDQLTVASVGLGFVSVGIALIAFALSRESERHMRALSRLEFREKIAVMKYHVSSLRSDQPPLHPCAIEGVMQDLRSALELRKWVKNEPSYKEFREALAEFVLCSGQMDQSDLNLALESLEEELDANPR